MDNLRVVRVPLIAVAAALVLFWTTDLHDAVFWTVFTVALAVTTWAEWRYWPRLRFRVLPRRWFR